MECPDIEFWQASMMTRFHGTGTIISFCITSAFNVQHSTTDFYQWFLNCDSTETGNIQFGDEALCNSKRKYKKNYNTKHTLLISVSSTSSIFPTPDDSLPAGNKNFCSSEFMLTSKEFLHDATEGNLESQHRRSSDQKLEFKEFGTINSFLFSGT